MCWGNLERSHDSEMMKTMELGQVSENVFPQCDLDFFLQGFYWCEVPSSKSQWGFLTEIGDFKHPENERKGFQVM